MTNIGLLSAIFFYALILIFFFKTRKKWDIHGIVALYRTALGLRLMNSLARSSPKFLKVLGYIGIGIGFFGMGFTFILLIKSALNLLFVEGALPGFAPVLPGVKIPGLPALGFWHWLIGIFVLAVVHEFAHGVLACVHNLEVKSSGFGFLGPILLAFVEPDEKKIVKSSKKVQLSVYAAGPFANFIFAALFALILFFVLGPLGNFLYEVDGFVVKNVTQGYDIAEKNIDLPFTILDINGISVHDKEFSTVFKELKPGETISLVTDKGDYTVVTGIHPEDKTKGFIGIQGEVRTKLRDTFASYSILDIFFTWTHLLFFWLFMLNLGVGLFNLLPLGPVDGGRMFFVVTQVFFKNEKTAKKVWLFMMYLVLFLIFVNLLPWLTKLISFLTGFFVK